MTFEDYLTEEIHQDFRESGIDPDDWADAFEQRVDEMTLTEVSDYAEWWARVENRDILNAYIEKHMKERKELEKKLEEVIKFWETLMWVAIGFAMFFMTFGAGLFVGNL